MKQITGYYLFAPIEKGCIGKSSGIEKKVRSQCKILDEEFSCKLMILPCIEYNNTFIEKIIRRLPYTAAFRKWKYNGEFNEANFLYIRQVNLDESFIRYLENIRRYNPTIKILFEIPTYPQNEVLKTISNLIFRKKEQNARKKLKKYIDRIITFYGQDKIWGIPCIKALNGYDFSKIIVPQRKQSNEINIISVALNAFWHGYDRMIEGIHNYYSLGGKEIVNYHIIGPKIQEYINLINKYNLNERIILHGSISGEELEKFYIICDMAIDVLGGHRKNYPISGSLKSREYAAWGLPIVTSSPIDYLPKDYKYQFIVPYDDSPINMFEVIKYYHSVWDDTDKYSISQKIHSYAKSKSDMSIVMKPIIDYINSNSNN